MFIAMNRFRVASGSEDAFERVWLSRDSHLDKVPGFIEFHLLKGPAAEDHTLYASHTIWASYAAFGVSEWSARFPSVLVSWFTVLLVYELARRMFGRGTGLLAGIILASAGQFAILSHAATPDATLLLFTVLTYLLFWARHLNGSRSWWVPTAAACGLAISTA